VHGTLSTLIKTYKVNSKKKKNSLHGDLTLDELKEIFIKQGGRCAYSRKIMETRGHWKMSLERVNPRKGYTKDNCVLICNCWNITDNTVRNPDINAETQGMSYERIKIIADAAKARWNVVVDETLMDMTLK
jgi:hypothetical protein